MDVFLVDTLHPEDVAMVQALYSRSPRSVVDHLAEVDERGSGDFMKRFYVGYGHKSIGDCGFTSLFLEGVSMLAAKAVQDNPLYSGQETSTRYIDFAKQGFVDPIGSDASREHLQSFVDFYQRAFEETFAHLKATQPRDSETKETVWEKALKARAFDITRSLLPVAMKTQLSWATNLRQAADHVVRMLNHPAKEVRDLAAEAARQLDERYPSSFDFEREEREDRKAYYQQINAYAYDKRVESDGVAVDFSLFDKARLSPFADVLRDRPRGCELPRALEAAGRISVQFAIDFGSFRDLQRHRGVHIWMPLISDKLGFESWYIDNLPPSLQEEATAFLEDRITNANKLAADAGLNEEEKQYFLPMGMKVSGEIVAPLATLAYLLELRSGVTVHPTLREVAWDIADRVTAELPEMALHIDRRPDEFQVKRGQQDIVKAEENAA